MKIQQNNQKTKSALHIQLIISIIINIILFIFLITNNNSNSSPEINQKLDTLISIQKEMAINGYLAKTTGTENSTEPRDAGSNFGLALLQQEIRDTIKKELAAVTKDSGGFEYADQEKKPAVQKIPAAAQKEAFQNGSYVVNDAIKNGSWTVSDAEKFRDEFHKMSREQQEKILQKLIPAMNRGELKAEPGAEVF
ncbi:MAG: hypothetical protein GY754_05345 [bacterium]|nr:hypothetical protein [bacterium]